MTGAVLVYGAGGHGKVVADAAQAAGWDVLGLADDNPARAGAVIGGVSVVAIGRQAVRAYVGQRDAYAVIAVGDNRVRRDVYVALREAGVAMATIVHPAATVSPSAALGAGTVVMAGAVINPFARVGDNAIVNTGATIDHDNEIGDHAHVAPGAHLGGTVTVGDGTLVGIGASVRNNVSIGAWSIVGVGAAVVADLPDRVVAFGNPARVQRSRPDD